MAFLGIGKKTPKKTASAPGAADESGAAEAVAFGESVQPVTTPAKKGLFGRKSKAIADKAPKAKSATKAAAKGTAPKARGPGGELNIYTGILAAACIALLAGCLLIAMDNLAGVAGTAEQDNPFARIPSR